MSTGREGDDGGGMEVLFLSMIQVSEYLVLTLLYCPMTRFGGVALAQPRVFPPWAWGVTLLSRVCWNSVGRFAG